MASDLDVVASPMAEPAAVHVGRGPAPRPLRWLLRVGVHLGVIGVFSIPALVLWGNALGQGVSSRVLCPCPDSGQQAWFIAWPAYALRHGLSPFSTTWLWAPHGVNLLANASAPLVGIVVSPITWALGPFAATTVALLLAPGLSAWGCWVACRRFVTWQPACWIAGFLFGYSPFVVESLAQGHLSIGLLVLPPLMLVVLHEILVRQQRTVIWCGVTLGLLAFAQFLISPEVLTLIVLIVAFGIVVATALAPHRARAAFPFALRAFAVTALVAMVLLAAPVWYMLAGPQHIHGSVWGRSHNALVAQAWELWSPGPYRAALGPGTLQGPQVQFLGFGVLIVAGLSLVMAWRRRDMWAMAIIAVMSTVLSWGGILWLSADHAVESHWLPWSWFTNRSVLDNISAIHFSALADLAVAVVIAIGLDTLAASRGWRWLPPAARAGIVGLVAAIALLPIWLTIQVPLTVHPIGLPQWYATAARHVPARSVVVSYPFPASAALTDQPMVWQAADGMRFRLAGGYIKVPGRGTGVIGTGLPGSAVRTMIDLTLAYGARADHLSLTAGQIEELRAALRSWGASYIVVVDTGAVPIEAAAVFTATTGRLPEVSHRAWVWDLGSQPLRTPYDAVSAARAFASCRLTTTQLSVVPRRQPLPQALNLCVAAGTRT